jgi:hypothetical protein
LKFRFPLVALKIFSFDGEDVKANLRKKGMYCDMTDEGPEWRIQKWHPMLGNGG